MSTATISRQIRGAAARRTGEVHSSTPSLAGSLAVAVTDLVAAVRERYREHIALARMSDRELKDIGLTRSDIGAAIHQGTGPARRAAPAR